MKKIYCFLGLAVFSFASARADFTVVLDAGLLTGPSGGSPTMVADNSNGSTNGSLLLLIDLGSSSTVSNSVQAGQYVSGTNFVLGAAGFNTNGDSVNNTNETISAFSISTAATVGDIIALRWFPQITLAQYNANTLPTAGQYFGTYTPTGTPDGGSAWVVPGTGTTINLNFFTTNTTEGGTQLPSAGYANFQVTAVPEPSVYALLALGLPMLVWAARRRGMKMVS